MVKELLVGKCRFCKHDKLGLVVKEINSRSSYETKFVKYIESIKIIKLFRHNRVTKYRDHIGNYKLIKCNGSYKKIKAFQKRIEDKCW